MRPFTKLQLDANVHETKDCCALSSSVRCLHRRHDSPKARSSKQPSVHNTNTVQELKPYIPVAGCKLNSKRMNTLNSSIGASTSSISMAATDEAPSPPPTTTASPAPAQQQEREPQPERGLLPAGAVPRTPRGTRHALPTRGLDISSAPDHGPYARMMRFFAAAPINSKNKAGNRSSSTSKRKRIIFPIKVSKHKIYQSSRNKLR